jgi:hypothetical protein
MLGSRGLLKKLKDPSGSVKVGKYNDQLSDCHISNEVNE